MGLIKHILYFLSSIYLIFVASSSLTSQQTLFLIIFSFIIWGWLLTKVDLYVTGVLGVCLCVFAGLIDTKEAFSSFSHPLIYLFLGGFLVAKGFENQQLDKKIAIKILNLPLVKGNAIRSIFALILTSGFFSMWISNTAVTALMLPICLSVMSNIDGLTRRSKGFILLMIAYASSIGGITTPVGSTPNIIAMALLKENLNIEIGFLEWMLQMLPITVSCLLILLIFIIINMKHLKLSIKSHPQNKRKLIESSSDFFALLCFCLMIILWFLPSFISALKPYLHPGVVALFFGFILFLLPFKKPILKSNDILSIDWPSLLLFGSGLAIGKVFFKSQLALIIAQFISANILGENIYFTLILLVAFTIFATELASNTATANVLVPIVISLGGQSPSNSIMYTSAIAIACSLAFMLPVSTPPNIIVYGTKKIKLNDMIKTGFFLNIIFILVISTLVYFTLS
ncbi:MAG: DASS family sodium-coupled anion symporter [Bacteriovoracaceae bacterium]|jgi:sodium-dependent dicarboxylate transporter 2/3/5|nr:DASS family sodium-coupled anion symporter [Bacteriovoracaceae bacterium]